jgi:hypothetical protein
MRARWRRVEVVAEGSTRRAARAIDTHLGRSDALIANHRCVPRLFISDMDRR